MTKEQETPQAVVSIPSDIRQRTNIDGIRRIKVNFTKDSKDRHNYHNFEVRLNRIENLWANTEALHPEIYGTLKKEKDQLKVYMAEYEEIEEVASDLITTFRCAMDTYKIRSDSVSKNNEEFEGKSSNDDEKIRLERVKIPRFDGNYSEWNSYRELFQVLVHNNNKLHRVQKMQYLVTSVGGEAKRLIENLSVSEANYEKAWELLNNRFNNKRVIMSTYLQMFLGLTTVKFESAISYKQILDTANKMMAGISGLGINTSMWDPIITHIATHKLDLQTRKEWELSLDLTTDFPTWQDFSNFISKKFRALELINADDAKKKIRPDVHLQVISKCAICKGDHRVYNCKKFLDATTEKRREWVKFNNLCFNCLGDHRVYDCKSKTHCKTCSKRHNSLLHENSNVRSKNNANNANESNCNHTNQANMWTVLLATAIIKVKNVHGEYVQLRALIDQGAQNSFITKSAAKVLGFKSQSAKVMVRGIGNGSKMSHGQIPLMIKEKWSDKVVKTVALVLGHVTNNLPTKTIKSPIHLNLKPGDLADPTYRQSGKIDVLLGADIYGEILLNGFKRGYPTAQKTRLGWILSGPTMEKAEHSQTISMVSTTELDTTLKKFWNQEEVQTQKQLTKEEQDAESHYQASVKRMENGKFEVRLPFKMDPRKHLAESCRSAIFKYISQEKRLAAKPAMLEQYNACLQEYLQLGHMVEVPKEQIGNPSYYLPHHAVIKEDRTTTKLRVVFNASSKTNSGKSLNDLLMVGPTIQDSLFALILRWRTYPIVLSSDIEKMYRCIQVNEKDVDWQRIVWRPPNSGSIKHFQLQTVTFGESSAPYQAIRTLKQLATVEKDRFPAAAAILLEDCYVDDVMTGTDTIEEAISLYNELTALLKMGGFNLRKWNSNDNEVIRNIPAEQRGTACPLSLEEEETTKTLGLQWHRHQDCFQFKILRTETGKITKRAIASQVASLFDPLGWLQPVIITGKIFLQRLWLNKMEWDDEVSEDLKADWMKYVTTLSEINKIKINRWIGTSSKDEFELHGFCDASSHAIAAVIYIRVINHNNDTHIVKLLTSKTKVAPLATQTIPRLELNSATMLVQLMDQTKAAFRNSALIPTYYWTDSKIVLAWLSDHPAKWNTFVANRVSQIHKASDIKQWHHIPGETNPADCATRGLTPIQLKECSLWWEGPNILHQSGNVFTTESIERTNLEKKAHIYAAVVEDDTTILDKFSNYTRLIRVVAYCRRLLPKNKIHREKAAGFLTSQELYESKLSVIKISQRKFFNTELNKLEKGERIDSTSRLLQLNPFIDTEGILRVGGRLQNAEENIQKHPTILSGKCKLSELLIRHFHHKTMHGSFQQTLSTTRQEFWILNANKLTKQAIHKCITCFKGNARPEHQQMGNLPETRVTLNKPFWSVGLDFAGPIKIKWSNGRGTKTTKAYIAVFICLATKAMHLELVGDLTSASCIAAVKRFISRRGQCKTIYSDCGTNFVAAGKELKQIFETMTYETEAWLANEQITWHHIPPSSPHFGGLWEAGVKSVKRHLVRTLGESLLNIEEMYTVLAQIEACLNSRPLAPLSSDVNDDEALTPAHFLVGSSMFAIPESTPDKTSLLKRWQLTQKLANDFWTRWHTEYLARLQERPKWLTPRQNLKPGQLVLVKNENTPSTKWPLARILEVHPGSDNLVRVVTIKLNGNITIRPVVKLCLLPIEEPSKEYDQNSIKRTIATPQTIDTEDDKPQRKRPRINTINASPLYWPLMILNLFAIFTSLPMAKSGLNNTPLSGGVFVEHLGYGHINRGTLQLNITIPIIDLRSDQSRIEAVKDNMTSLCESGNIVSREVQCDILNHHLLTMTDDINHKIDSILLHRNRLRRGVLGKLLTTIFGVNDEVYHDIDQLSLNQENIRSTLANHDKLMLKATKTLNTTNGHIEQQLNRFNEKLNSCIQHINAVNHWYTMVDHNKIHIHYLSTYEQVENYLSEVRRKYDCLGQIISNHGNIWDCSHVTDFLRILNKTKSLLPHDLAIYTTSTSAAQVEISSNYVCISGQLSIFETKQYELLKVTALPQPIKDNTFAIYDFDNAIWGVNYDLETYFELEEDTMKTSIQMGGHAFIVQQRVLYKFTSNPNCILAELYNSFEGTKCPTRQVSISSTIWKQTYISNTWLYTTPSQTLLQTVCSGKRTEVIIRNTGIIKFTPDCFVSTKKVILTAQQTERSAVLSVYIKPTTLTINTTIEQSFIPAINTSTIISSAGSFLDLIQEASANHKELADTKWNYIRRHVTSATVSISVSVLITILILLWCSYARKIKVRNITAKWYVPQEPKNP